MEVMPIENYKNVHRNENFSVDKAWELHLFVVVLSHLKNDSKFPDGFDRNKLDEEDEVQRDLIEWAKKMALLHDWIDKDNLGEVKLFTEKNKSGYYYNEKNNSAAFTALEKRNFKIYAYFKSLGVSETQKEVDEKKKMKPHELRRLEFAMEYYLLPEDKNYYFHLRANTKFLPKDSFEQRGKKLISSFKKVLSPTVLTILKVIECVEDLSIIIDLNKKDISDICPSETKKKRGKHYRKSKKICVGAGVNRLTNRIAIKENGTNDTSTNENSTNEGLGALVHELTHMAMYTVFDNDSKPYYKKDIGKECEFQKLALLIREKLSKIKVSMITDHPLRIILDAFKPLNKNKTQKEIQDDINREHTELVARIPHIIVQYSGGEKWLDDNFPELFKFFEDSVISECQKYIEKNSKSFQKLRKSNRNMNEVEGEIFHIRDKNLIFRDEIKNFFEEKEAENNRYFVFYSKFTWLTLKKALQAFYGKEYGENYDRFLALKFKNVKKNWEEVKNLFDSDVTEKLFIECSNETETKLRKIVIDLVEIVEAKKNKKIFFILENKSKELTKIFEEVAPKKYYFEKEINDDFNVSELAEESQEQFLEKPIVFQGQNTSLSNMVSVGGEICDDLLKCLNAEIIHDLVVSEKIEIGDRPLGISSLESAYADAIYTINYDSLIHEIKKKLSKNIFVIIGKSKSMQIKLLTSLEKKVGRPSIAKLKEFEFQISEDAKEKVFITKKELTDDDFKIFCSFNPKKKIYLLERSEDYAFKMLQLYNPDFYFKREYKYKAKIIIKKNIRKKDNLRKFSDVLIIKYPTYIELINRTELHDIETVTFENINIEIEKLSQLQKPYHVLKFENDRLIWTESFGPLTKLRDWIDEDFMEEPLNESELISEIEGKKVVILADDPGMGKSTTLTKLYEKEIILNNYWVIRINLSEHLKSIEKMNENVNVKDIVTFLKEIDPKLKNNISEKFLEAAIDPDKRFSKSILICFDGFDEILGEKCREKVQFLLTFLKKSTDCKIWVTTRLHFKEKLEDLLSVFSVRFVPIDNDSKKDFIRFYMKDRLTLTFNPKKCNEIFKKSNDSPVEIYADQFLKEVQNIFKTGIEKFMGTPLQLHLMLEGSASLFREWTEKNDQTLNKKESIEKMKSAFLNLIGKNLIEVCKKFSDRKYQIYYRKKNLFEDEMKFIMEYTFEKCHEEIASSLISKKNLIDEIGKLKASLLLLGLIQTEGNNFQFIYFPFRDYFFTQRLIKSLKSRESEKFLDELDALFIDKILSGEKENYELIRKFMDLHLGNKQLKSCLKEREQKFRAIITSCYNPDQKAKYCPAFQIAIEEKNNNILEFLFTSSSEKYNFISILENGLGNEPLLHLAIRKNNFIAFEIIIYYSFKHKAFKNLLKIVDKNKKDALGIAEERENKVFASILSRIKQLFSTKI